MYSAKRRINKSTSDNIESDKGNRLQKRPKKSQAKKITLTESIYSHGETFSLPLDKVFPFEENPRIADNQAYDDLYLSIKVKGFQGNLAVTQRPNSDKYILSCGGKTRYKVLSQLFQETGDEKYNSIPVTFNNYVSEERIFFDHLSENDDRDDYVFIDRAIAVVKIKEIYEKKEGKSLSSRELSALSVDNGYNGVKKSTVSEMLYAVEFILPVIPDLLRKHKSKNNAIGMGSRAIANIRKLYNSSLKAYLEVDNEHIEENWSTIFYKTLASFNTEKTFDINDYQRVLEKRYKKETPKNSNNLSDAIEENKKPKKQKNDNSEGNGESNSNIAETSVAKIAVQPPNDTVRSNKSLSISLIREDNYTNACILLQKPSLKGLITKFDGGTGFIINTIDLADTVESYLTVDIAKWWMLFSSMQLNKVEAEKDKERFLTFFKLHLNDKVIEGDLQFLNELSSGRLTPEIASNYFVILVNGLDKKEFEAFSQIQANLHQLNKLLDGNIWNEHKK